MPHPRVFVIGDSMFADTIIQTLSNQERVMMAGSAPTVEAALELMRDTPADVVVYVDAGGGTDDALCAVTARYPDLAFIRADLTSDQMRLVTSKSVRARSDELVAAISSVPASSISENGSEA